MRASGVVAVAALISCALMAPHRVASQFIYLDSDGDSLSSANDSVSQTGPTAADIWLQTDVGKDGQKIGPSTISGQGDLTINSYEFILRAVGGTVEWLTYENMQPAMGVHMGPLESATDYYTFYGGSEVLPPGKYRLGRISFRVKSGTPHLVFASRTALWASAGTSFGSKRVGKDSDNTLKFTDDSKLLGARLADVPGDWADAQGLAVAATTQLASALPGTALARFSVLVAPNPANPEAKITVHTTRDGYLRVRLFDVTGRLVSALLDLNRVPAGSYSARVPKDRGTDLASGVYFYKVESPEKETHGAIVILK